MIKIGLLFFFSGFAALIYQLVWFRHLGLIFGNTVHAAATVIAAFMLGLAIGAKAAGRYAQRLRRPIHAFALLEVLIALYALCLPVLFKVILGIYRWGYQNISDAMWFVTPLRFVLAMLILAVPTILMGATLPVLAQGLLRAREHFGRRLGWLYGINTLGAVAGVLASGFILVPALGLAATNGVAIGIDLAVAAGALAVARTWKGAAVKEAEEELPAAGPTNLPVRARCILLAVAASGFLSLAFEVVWFRTLVLIFGSTTYSFSAMLAVFLLGIALGSLILSWLADRMKVALLVFAITEVGIGIYSVWSFYQFDAQPYFLLNYLIEHDFTWGAMIAAKFRIAFFFLFVPTLLFGVDIPIAARAFREYAPNAPRTIGDVYMWNTIGAVLGSVLAGFFLLPRIGMLNSLTLLACLTAVLGIFLAVLQKGFKPLRAAVVLAALAAIAVVMVMPPQWSRKLLAAGPYFTPWKHVQGGEIILDGKLESERLVYFEEGITATVAATRQDDERLLYISDGKVEADTSERSMMLQRMMGHLPMLFHPDPQRAVNIGLGAGVTFGALSCYPLDVLEVVEIEPGAVGVAGVWAPYNDAVLQHPDARVIINDGRNYLLCTTGRYDVITSDPFEPVHSGANNLYTVEHFRTARQRLTEDGIMCQYLPLYELSAEDYSSILASFLTVFPDTLLFYTGDDTILLGFNGAVDVDARRVEKKFSIPAVRESLAGVGIDDPADIFGMFVGDLTGSGLAESQRLNTDNHPYVEFSAPRHALHLTSDINQKVLLDHATPVPVHIVEELDTNNIVLVERNREALLHCLRSNVLRVSGDMEGAFELLKRAYQTAPGNAVIRNQLADLLSSSADELYRQGRRQEAINQYQMVLQLRPDAFWALFKMTEMAMLGGRTDIAGQLVERALESYPDSGIMAALNGKYQFSMGRFNQAMTELERALDLMPDKQAIWDDYDLIRGEIMRIQAQVGEEPPETALPPFN